MRRAVFEDSKPSQVQRVGDRQNPDQTRELHPVTSTVDTEQPFFLTSPGQGQPDWIKMVSVRLPCPGSVR